MIFRGRIPFTTVDFTDRLACVFFCGKCNMRCRFCHNPHLVFDPESQPAITEHDVLDFLEKRCDCLEGVVISGGEPTVHRDLPEFLAKVQETGYDVKLDTNGSHPDLISRMVEEGLIQAIGFDYKHLVEHYRKVICVPGFQDTTRQMLEMIPNFDIPVDVRTTVHRLTHSPGDLAAMRVELDRYGIVKWTIQQFNNVEVIDDTLNSVESYSDVELKKITAGLHDTGIRG